MRYWVHHESECIWFTSDDIQENEFNIEVEEIDETAFNYLDTMGYTISLGD